MRQQKYCIFPKSIECTMIRRIKHGKEGKYHNDSIEQVNSKESSKIVQIWNMSLLWILGDS